MALTYEDLENIPKEELGQRLLKRANSKVNSTINPLDELDEFINILRKDATKILSRLNDSDLYYLFNSFYLKMDKLRVEKDEYVKRNNKLHTQLESKVKYIKKLREGSVDRAFKKCYYKVRVFTIEEILPLLLDHIDKKIKIDYKGHTFGVGSVRLVVFKNNQTCHFCGNVGTHFTLESSGKDMPHLNMYTIKDGIEVLMNKHSLDGTSRNDLGDYVVRCADCKNPHNTKSTTLN